MVLCIRQPFYATASIYLIFPLPWTVPGQDDARYTGNNTNASAK